MPACSPTDLARLSVSYFFHDVHDVVFLLCSDKFCSGFFLLVEVFFVHVKPVLLGAP